jgi:hypothetical protein
MLEIKQAASEIRDAEINDKKDNSLEKLGEVMSAYEESPYKLADAS